MNSEMHDRLRTFLNVLSLKIWVSKFIFWVFLLFLLLVKKEEESLLIPAGIFQDEIVC